MSEKYTRKIHVYDAVISSLLLIRINYKVCVCMCVCVCVCAVISVLDLHYQ